MREKKLLMRTYISAQAEYQESIANQLSSVASEKTKKLEGEKQKMQQLSDALEEQRQTVNEKLSSQNFTTIMIT